MSDRTAGPEAPLAAAANRPRAALYLVRAPDPVKASAAMEKREDFRRAQGFGQADHYRYVEADVRRRPKQKRLLGRARAAAAADDDDDDDDDAEESSCIDDDCECIGHDGESACDDDECPCDDHEDAADDDDDEDD